MPRPSGPAPPVPTAREAPSTASRARLATARRIVVKVGTNVVMRDDGALALGRIYGLVESIGTLRKGGKEVLLVSSGAVGLGAQRLELKEKPKQLALKQACAAIGQSRLMSVYEQGFEKLGLLTAQVLLTEDDFTSRARYLNLRATLEKLLELGTVPILNENDTVSTRELAEGVSRIFGDNDKLSALVASKLDANLLVILSDVDGLHTANPARSRGAERIPLVEDITPEIEALADGGGVRGRGGMGTKLEAARIATRSGCTAIVMNGRAPNVLERLFAGEDVGTLFLPHAPLAGKKRWIAFASAPAGSIVVNAGARDALLLRKASLLPAGVVRVSGRFERGDVVSIVGPDGRELARGMASHGSADAANLIDPPRHGVELVNRDNILITEEER